MRHLLLSMMVSFRSADPTVEGKNSLPKGVHMLPITHKIPNKSYKKRKCERRRCGVLKSHMSGYMSGHRREATKNSVCMKSPEVFWESRRQVETDGQPMTETLGKKQGKSCFLEM